MICFGIIYKRKGKIKVFQMFVRHKNRRGGLLSKRDRENGLAEVLKTYGGCLIKRDG